MMTTSSTGRRIVGDMYEHHDFLVVTETSLPPSSLLSFTNNVECWIKHNNNNNNNKTDNPSATLMKNPNLWNSKLLLLPAADSINEDWVDYLFEEDDTGSVTSMTSTMMRFCPDDDDHQQQDSDDMIRVSRLTLENIIDVAVASIKTYQERPFGTSSVVKDDTTNQTAVIPAVIDRNGKLSDLKNERVIEKEEEENNSTCSSTLDDWDEVFGEDGSISEDCDCELLRRLPFTMIETNNNEEGGGEGEDYDEVLNPTTENWDSLFGQDDNDKHKEECKKSDLTSSTKSIAGNTFVETSDSDINRRYDMNRSSPMTDESSGIDDKDKENPRSSSTNTQVLPPPGFSCQKMEILEVNTNCTVTTKTKTTLINNNTSIVSNKRISVPTNKDETEFSKEAQSKQKEQQQYDSVWDVNFQQGEEEKLAPIVVPMNDSGTVASDTPEDWEALLDDDDDEESVSGTRSKEEIEIPPQDDILVVPVPTNDVGSMISDTPEDWEALLEEDDDESVSGTRSKEEMSPQDDIINDEENLTTIVLPTNDGESMVSYTPEDWEALLEDDDESEPGTRSKEEEILLQDDIIGAQEVDVFPSKIAKKKISTPAKNIDNSKRLQSKQQQQYDSVWDMTFQEEENLPTTIVSMHDGRTIISKSFACLEGNPDPPEDWEAMLADEEESISGTRSKEIPLRDDIVRTQEVEAFRSKIFAVEKPLTLTEKKKIIPRKKISERQDCATTSKKNLRPCWKIESSITYNSVWEMCSKANDECRLDHNYDRATTSSSESTTSLMLHQHHCSEPQVEWEDFYS